MKISTKKFNCNGKTYRITIKRFKNGIVHDDIIDLYDDTDVFYKFDFNTIQFKDMKESEIRDTIMTKFISDSFLNKK